ncbi:unnamed protein product [Pleuronectes platessa]|uniref:Uncharacterized protein n=1 Tax=Pleuronectes platessa TaxID=8262 RepID=A0A9N7YQZ6_PLEPL|nr:unnamed protein product [Pleuronectes platessa]
MEAHGLISLLFSRLLCIVRRFHQEREADLVPPPSCSRSFTAHMAAAAFLPSRVSEGHLLRKRSSEGSGRRTGHVPADYNTNHDQEPDLSSSLVPADLQIRLQQSELSLSVRNKLEFIHPLCLDQRQRQERMWFHLLEKTQREQRINLSGNEELKAREGNCVLVSGGDAQENVCCSTCSRRSTCYVRTEHMLLLSATSRSGSVSAGRRVHTRGRIIARHEQPQSAAEIHPETGGGRRRREEGGGEASVSHRLNHLPPSCLDTEEQPRGRPTSIMSERLSGAAVMFTGNLEAGVGRHRETMDQLHEAVADTKEQEALTLNL